jgi:endonuclease III
MTIQDILEESASPRLSSQLADLQRFYGLLAPPPNDAYALFAWEVLSRQSLPAGRDAAMADLRRAHILTPDAVVRAPRAALEAAVAPAGSSVALRLDALKAGAEVFRRHRTLPVTIRGPLPNARRSLRLLPQLDPPGAHRMLLFAGDHPIVPVDARVLRVAARLGYAGSEKPPFRRTRLTLGALLGGEREAFRRAFIYLSHHGSLTCTDRDPHCRVCPLAPECPEALGALQRSRQSEL